MTDADDDKAAVDRAFADLVAGFHVTAERPDPSQPSDWDEPAHHQHPASGSVFEAPAAAPQLDGQQFDGPQFDGPQPEGPRREGPPSKGPRLEGTGTGSQFETPAFELPDIDVPEPADEPEPAVEEERYDPGPVAPLPRPAWPVLLGWIGIGYALVTMLVGAFGFALPSWAAWTGIIAFAAGFGLLLSQLPRHRPPDAGDGAVL